MVQKVLFKNVCKLALSFYKPSLKSWFIAQYLAYELQYYYNHYYKTWF
jgi:hypothetical protein